MNLQPLASRETAMSTDQDPAPIPITFSPAIFEGNEGYASVTLPLTALHKQGQVEDAQYQTVVQSPWNNVEYAVSVIESMRAPSRLQDEVGVSDANIERPSSEAIDAGGNDKENWNSLESISTSTRKPFEDGWVDPSSWLHMSSNALFRPLPVECFETVALSPPTKPFSWRPIRRRKHKANSAHLQPSPTPSSSHAQNPTAGSSRTSHGAPTIPSDVDLLPHSTRPSNKRPRACDADAAVVSHPRKKMKSEEVQVAVLGAMATYIDAHGGEAEVLQSVEDGHSEAMAAATGHVGIVTAGLSHYTPGPERAISEEAVGDALAESEAYAEAVEDVKNGHFPGVPVPAPVTNVQQYRQRPRRTNDEIDSTLVPGIQACIYGFPGCDFELHPRSGNNNRVHVKKAHYTIAQLKSNNQLICDWDGCGISIEGNTMMVHIERDHIGYGYLCPVAGCPYDWKGSRAKDQSLHMNRKHAGWRE
ncbi:hypothetical protein TRAPUB_6923 [Trametes pubescens]|uniref:Uncharacterized protein n=1 Tax=Trametes pubescens TaxID=154538 RepID=A0A1M2V4M0_TRAPU|nr:hypothetical protein TRAPUB_6923 [Trametes pubescens]